MISEAVLATAVVIGVIYDLRERRIPNWITVPAIVLGLGIQTVGGGAGGLAQALLGAAAGMALLMVPFALGWVGGGDMKLLAAVGALMGAPFAFWTLVFASAIGGLMALGWVAMKGSLASSLGYIIAFWRRGANSKPVALVTSLSFGPALALGVLMARVWA